MANETGAEGKAECRLRTPVGRLGGPALARGCLIWILTLSVSAGWNSPASADEHAAADRYFGIRVVDSQTGRGVPLVRLATVNGIVHFTDSAGWVAFHEPGLMDTDVFFRVSSHGYEYPADGFGIRGIRLRTTPGTSAQVEIARQNLAERLYRVTGGGIYRDSVLLGQDVPIHAPTLNGRVLGQDTVQATPYRGRIHWFWGDTNRPSYPLGNFKTSGATSLLPEDGGLDPQLGINLNYSTDTTGFSRSVAPLDGPGAIWLHGLFVLRSHGNETMLAHYSRLKSLGKILEHGLVLYDDQAQTFERLVKFDEQAALFPRGQSLAYEHDVNETIYFCTPFPSVRVKATLEDIQDPTRYESFTCLKQGTRYQLGLPDIARDQTGKLVVDDEGAMLRREESPPQIDRNEEGDVVWGWKPNTGAIDASQQWQLIQKGYLKPEEARFLLWDPDRQERVHLHAGSVHWNEHRDRWIMVAEQFKGRSSFLGEIWYAESKRLEGPWVNARHIVTHDKYSFYNPAHHPFFDQDGGRVIYFEGTYADTFSAARVSTPRYNYNQIMYRLELDDSRMGLPSKDE